MTAFDCLGLLRRLINDPLTSGPRYSDATLLDFISEGQVQAVRETSSPKAYQVFSTQNVVTLSGTPTTGENVVLNINNIQIVQAETTGQSLTTLAGLVATAVNANVGINTVVQASAVGPAVGFIALGTGFTANSATIGAVQGVHVTQTISYVQEYQVFEQLLTDAVYCAGKLLTPSSTAILEGWNFDLWSQNCAGTTPAPGSGAVPGTVGQGAPSWVGASPRVFPSNTGLEDGIKPTVQPYSNFQGNLTQSCQAERYYWRDPGTIGIVPQPANLCQVVIYGVCTPPPVTTPTQSMLVPQSYRMYVVRYAEWLCRSSENSTNPGQAILIENAYNDMLRERANCILKVRNAKGKVARTFNSIPQRLSRSRYMVRRSGGGNW
jgi:hypothetical protein